MWIIEWLLDIIFNLVQKITAENSMYIGVAVIIALGYFGVFLNIYVLACIFLLNIGFIYLSKHKSYSFYSKYKNKSVQNFNLAYESAHEVFFLLFMFVDFIDLPKLFLFHFSCLTILFFTLMSIGVLFFEEKTFSHKASLLFSSIVSLISIVILYAIEFGFFDYLALPFMANLAFICIMALLSGLFVVDDKDQTILLGTFKLKNWGKFLFAFVVQASFVVLLCLWDHPELLTLLFGLPTLQYISRVILLVPLVYVYASLVEYLYTGLPLLYSKDSEMMIKMGYCFLSVVLFGLPHMRFFPFTLLGILHCFSCTLPTSVALLAIAFYSNGIEYSSGLRYAIILLSLILFPGSINGSLVASVSLMQICWAFLDAALRMVVPVLLVFFYEMTYYKGWAYGSNLIEKAAMDAYLNPFKDCCKENKLKIIRADGLQLFYDILTGLNISSKDDWKVFYRRAFLVFHPDKGGSVEHSQSLSAINVAVENAENYTTYSILKSIKELAPAVEESHDDEQISKYFHA